MLTRPGSDLEVLAPPALTWTAAGSTANLEQLYDWAQRVANEAVTWYLTGKRRKARWSRRLRTATATLTALGSAVPIAALAAGRPTLGNWGYVLLALAAGCLGYDRFFGYSSSYLRYVAAATRLRRLANDFQLQWVAELASLGGRDPSADDTTRSVELVRQFVGTVHETVRAETESWLTEFHAHLNEMEGQLREIRLNQGSSAPLS